MTRSEILEQARKCVCGDREQDYGSPESNFQTIAEFWMAYLKKAVPPGTEVTILPEDVAAMLGLLKIARISSGHAKEDNWIDLAGYAACGGEIQSGGEGAHEGPVKKRIVSAIPSEDGFDLFFNEHHVSMRWGSDGCLFGTLELGGLPTLVLGRSLNEAMDCFIECIDGLEEEKVPVNFPDHPVIRNMERTGYPDGKLPNWTCPFCGSECTTVYSDWHGEAVGCENCVDRHNVEDFYGEE